MRRQTAVGVSFVLALAVLVASPMASAASEPVGPVVVSLTPAAGPTSTPVVITGIGLSDVASVTFGGVSARFTVVSDDTVRTVVPDAARTGDVVVTDAAGMASVPQQFSVTAPSPGWAVVLDGSYAPPTVPVSVGSTVHWQFRGENPHTVTDASALGMYDSGSVAPGGTFAHTFFAAGAFPYRSSTDSGMTGTIRVEPDVSPRHGTTQTEFAVGWALDSMPAGHVADVQVRRPGSSSFVTWRTAQTGPGSTFAPDAGAGQYAFRARVRQSATGKTSSWSPAVTVEARDDTPGAPYLTLLMGRTQWSAAPGCSPLPGAVPLDRIAADLSAMGLSATGAVVVGFTQEEGQYCSGGTLYPNWEQLAMLRDTHGWRFVSQGLTYRVFDTLTAEEQREESCGSLPSFEARGHEGAWGLFGYPGGNDFPPSAQTDIVSTCFAYGRTYSWGINDRSSMAPPWLQKTHSVDGGACNNPALACSDPLAVGSMLNGRAFHYRPPVDLVEAMAAEPDEWSVVQMYRLVTGAYEGANRYSWDCTDPDWRNHWTARAELYCYDDFLWAVGSLLGDVVVTDPASVAEAWGRHPSPSSQQATRRRL
jgi:plastocyanin